MSDQNISGEEVILEAFKLVVSGKCFPGLIQAYYQRSGATEDFETVMARLLLTQRIVIMPDGDYQINVPVSP